MIAEGNEWLATAPWTSLWPGLAIALVVMACNALGDGLRNALDPRMDVA
jgi:peptide/nickel transport system permease protein